MLKNTLLAAGAVIAVSAIGTAPAKAEHLRPYSVLAHEDCKMSPTKLAAVLYFEYDGKFGHACFSHVDTHKPMTASLGGMTVTIYPANYQLSGGVGQHYQIGVIRSWKVAMQPWYEITVTTTLPTPAEPKNAKGDHDATHTRGTISTASSSAVLRRRMQQHANT